ncbi:MAG: Sua5/YciO/YrdC/YwlC family protein [Solirubrobacteraceae bacterium]
MSGTGVRGRMAGAFEREISEGGVVLFPADTVYGLACDPYDPTAIARLYALKRRPSAKAAAVMFFDLEAALAALPELGQRTTLLLRTLLPGPVTVLVPNPRRRFGLLCGDEPQTLGLRVVAVPELAEVHVPVMQSSANLSGSPAPAALELVDAGIQDGADLVIDGGRLPGRASTVLDLRQYEARGAWTVVRDGPLSHSVIAAAAAAPFHFDPRTYTSDVAEQIHDYQELQAELVRHTVAANPDRILELGVGTGETSGRLLRALPRAQLLGCDASPAMLAAARVSLGDCSGRFQLLPAMLQEPLPQGPFEAVVSALTVHHLDVREKADLFCRVHAALSPGGVFVLADVVVPDRAAGELIELSEGFDKPSPTGALVAWMREAGFASVDVPWQRDDLAVIVATR